MEEKKFNLIFKGFFIKDLSFESPMVPEAFNDLSSSPQIGFNFESNINDLGNDVFELTLTFNVKAEVENKILYMVELKQSESFQL